MTKFIAARSSLSALGRGLASLGRTALGAERAREAARLLSITDAQLAEMDLSRDRIVHHVFRRYAL